MAIDLLLKRFRCIWALACVAWGVFSFDTRFPGWSITGSIVFFGPLFCQLSRYPTLRIYPLWFATALALQSTFPRYLTPQIRGPANVNRELRYREGNSLGIAGTHHVTTDAQGFRVTAPLDYAKKAEPRIFVYGASTAEQLFLDDHRTSMAILEKRLRKSASPTTRVVGTAVSGTVIRHQLAMFRRTLAFRPDVAVFLIGVNDWNYHIKEGLGTRRAERSGRYLLRVSPLGKLLFPKATSLDNIEAPDGRIIDDPYARLRGSLNRKRVLSFHPSAVSASFASGLKKIGVTCRESKIRCVFLTQPTAYARDLPIGTLNQFWMTPFLEDYTVDLDSMIHLAELYNRHILDFAHREGFLAFDLASQLAPGLLHFYDDVHFNEAGAARVGETLADFLTLELPNPST